MTTPDRLVNAETLAADFRQRINESIGGEQGARIIQMLDWTLAAISPDPPGDPARRLIVETNQHLERVSREVGYTHPEHLSGQEWPATDIPCLPTTVAQQVVEKHLMEAAIPPDPRLDALLEMAAGFMAHAQQTDKTHTACVEMFALRDALAAFEEAEHG